VAGMTDKLWWEWINAAADNDVQRVTELLAVGMEVGTCDEHGQTAFSYACAYNSLATAKLLHAAGADVNAPLTDGDSPLDCTSTFGSAELRDWLISVGGRRNSHYEGAAEFEHNNSQPVLSAMAAVVSKRTAALKASAAGGREAQTSYFVTFQLAAGPREFGLDPEVFASLTEGEQGVLRWQGTRFCGFVS
jgi:hypothetical protein